MIIEGANIVQLCLKHKPEIIIKVFIKDGRQNKIDLARLKKLKLNYVIMKSSALIINKKVLAKKVYVAALIKEVEYYSYQMLTRFLQAQKHQKQTVVILDHTDSPANLGNMLRSCYFFKVDIVVITKKQQVKINETVIATSAGAALVQKICLVSNLSLVFQKLKKIGFWLYGTTVNPDEALDYKQVDYADKKALVIGNEHQGMRPKLKQKCDQLITIKSKQQFDSLNVSMACAILLATLCA